MTLELKLAVWDNILCRLLLLAGKCAFFGLDSVLGTCQGPHPKVYAIDERVLKTATACVIAELEGQL